MPAVIRFNNIISGNSFDPTLDYRKMFLGNIVAPNENGRSLLAHILRSSPDSLFKCILWLQRR